MWRVPETLKEIAEAGDDRIVLELIDSFQRDTAARLKRLHEALARFDAGTVQAEAHSVRGAARQMGAEALADLCRSVEAAAPGMDWPELERRLNQVELGFAELRFAMSEYVDAKGRAG
jgi:HPt (histidine-containing phosphotransfer) domain-containing protein